MDPEGPVAAYLKGRGVPFHLVRHPKTVRTRDLPPVRGVALGQIMKNLLFVDEDDRPLLCILGCDREVNPARVRELVGSGVRLAGEEEVRRVTGFPTGNVPSIVPGLRKLVDSSVLGLETVSICACLDNDAGVNLLSRDFLEVLDNFQIAAFSFLPKQAPSEGRIREFSQGYGLSDEVARALLTRTELLDAFDGLIDAGRSAKVAGPFLTSTWTAVVSSLGKGTDPGLPDAKVPALNEIVRMIEEGTISRNASERVLAAVLTQGVDPWTYVKHENLKIVPTDFGPIIERVISSEASVREQLIAGNPKIVQFLIGRIIAEAGIAVDRKAAAQAVQAFVAKFREAGKSEGLKEENR